MRSSVLLIGAFLVAIACMVTSAFAQSGQVTGGSITDCDQPYDVGWSGTWTGLSYYHEVRGFCEPNYVFGSVPEVTDDNVNSSSPGTSSVQVDATYYFEGYNYHLVGAYVWFEFGYEFNGYWYMEGCTSWYYIDYVPTCLAAGTPVVTQDGSKLIEELTARDRVLSCPANNPGAQPTTHRVKEVIQSRAHVVDITVDGRTVRASREHPFYVKGKAWTPAAALRAGDLLRTRDERWLPVKSIVDGGEIPVYNLRVDKDSTYFVGDDDWGFSLWVYGACSKTQTRPEGFVRPHSNRRGPREISGPVSWQRRGLH